MKQINIRVDGEIEKMLGDINVKPTPAAQTTIEVLLWLRRATLHELKGRFTREEIIALADSFNGLIPTWQIMCNPSVLVMHTEDAEKYQYSASQHGADPMALIEKLKVLTAAQATILQLELVSFWTRDDNTNPDLETLIETLL
jgi:hypothetical protein